jgi:acetyl esterase
VVCRSLRADGVHARRSASDPLHDEGEEYADKLASAGVDMKYHCYPGQVHSFFREAGLMDASRDAVARIAAFLTPRL